MNCNGINYHKVEVLPGKWQWVVNEEAERRQHEHNQHRKDLYWALRSRILTDEEMDEVAQYGDSLCIEPMVSYYPAEKKQELNDALLQQFRMRQKAA